MTTPPVGPSSGNTEPQEPQQVQPTTPKTGAEAIDTDDPWYIYAKHMFPNSEITPEIVAGLKKNMNTMINTTVSEVNKRHEENQKYIKEVAQGG